MTPARIISRLATSGAYASGVTTVAFWWLDRPNRVAFAAFVAFAAVALVMGRWGAARR